MKKLNKLEILKFFENQIEIYCSSFKKSKEIIDEMKLEVAQMIKDEEITENTIADTGLLDIILKRIL